MKQLYIVMLAALLGCSLLYSCDKNKEEPDPNQLTGKWQIASTKLILHDEKGVVLEETDNPSDLIFTVGNEFTFAKNAVTILIEGEPFPYSTPYLIEHVNDRRYIVLDPTASIWLRYEIASASNDRMIWKNPVRQIFYTKNDQTYIAPYGIQTLEFIRK